MKLEIDQHRLQIELDRLAGFSSEASPVVTRVVFAAADQQARQYLYELFVEAGLSVRVDPVGNTFARWEGSGPALPAVATGSHTDAIPNAGKYDGTVGVLGGLEAIRALRRSGYLPRRSIELVLFTAEEPTRFGIGCLGSRMLCGSLSAEAASDLRDSEGNSLESLRAAAGFAGDFHEVALRRGHYDSFVELHIEQGRALEEKALAIGIVESIAAPASLNFSIEGEGGHAGTVLMADRKDAFMAACALSLGIEETVRIKGGADTVATVGKCKVFPGAVNSVPSQVDLTLDLRDTDGDRRDKVLQEILQAGQAIAAERKVVVDSQVVNSDPPARCDGRITKAIRLACEEHGKSFQPMVSRAYHDTLFLSRIAPVGMIFIPCRGGVSHRPDEYASPEQIAAGVLVLAETLAQLSAEGGSAERRLREWNDQSEAEALILMLACCGSAAFAQQMIGARPFADDSELQSRADAIWWSLTEADWREAFLCHPRIGEDADGRSQQFASWSAEEQAGARAGTATILETLTEKNREYEELHGFRYIVCASGRSADELLSILERRIANPRGVEVREAAEQQRQITQLRLRKWLEA